MTDEIARLRSENARLTDLLDAAREAAEKGVAACGEVLNCEEAASGGNYDDAYYAGWNRGEASAFGAIRALLSPEVSR